VAAGYALYGSATMIVISIGNGPVNGFMLDPVSEPSSKNPKITKIYLYFV